MEAPAVPDLAPLEEALGLPFRDRHLLQLAFVHGSYLNEHGGLFHESNERLEFLGDALIGLVTAEELYRRFPDRPEGDLTAMRSLVIRRETLARVARSLDLGRYLAMGRGEARRGGRQRARNLAAAYEALVGALFLDQGYETARAFVLRTLEAELKAVGQTPWLKDPKSLLQEAVQARRWPQPEYRTVRMEGTAHEPRFTVEVVVQGRAMGQGQGRRKVDAERQAAREALAKLTAEDGAGEDALGTSEPS